MRIQGSYPLTMGQLSMWKALMVRPPEQLWESNLDLAWPIPAGITVEQVRHTLTALALRHESLRTVYRPADEPGEVRQAVLRDPLVRFAQASVREPFDLTEQPAWRAWVHTCDDEPPQVQLVIHHIAADGAAVRTLESDFYALLRDEPLRAAPAPRELAERQRSDAFRDRLTAAGEYRRQMVTAVPRTPVSRGALLRAHAHTGIPYGAARRAAQHLQVTLPNLLLAVYAQVLAASTGVADQLLWQLSANRLEPSVRRLVSSMTQWVPMLASCDPGGPLGPVAREVNVAAVNAMRHGVYDPFAVGTHDFDHGSYFTFLPPPDDADPEPSEVTPGRIEWLPPRAYSGASFYLVARAYPSVQLTLRVMRDGYGRADVERFLTAMVDLLLRSVEDAR
ncbi:condensation domain-containing protein [Micromonospora avicenniae]|uniref:Condensation domain-containing protein n=1 Tax=Micromonospora avicenniae TaxID=1198245 RepID=A0A1N6ZRF5_9ACTN|nr:condensation domain-containing protein [Micromonospora avicenniae]SIR29473.1 Condensation domain-containing protein [Micromonospora avicenniae]